MIGFFLAAGVMLLIALLIFLIPVLRVRKFQTEEDRTALNVALYQENLDELEAQFVAGALTAEQLTQGKAEAARVLLQDTETGAPKNKGGFGVALPLIAALLIPVAGIAMYWHWGAYDNAQLTLSMGDQPESIEELIERMERVVKAQPNSIDALFLLGRTYMNAEQPKPAADVFKQAIDLAGRQPELLAQWAQAEYFANNKQWNDELQAAVNEVLQDNPNEPTVLGLIGIAAFEGGDYQTSINAWTRLADHLQADDPSLAPIRVGIEHASNALAEKGSTPFAASPTFSDQSSTANDKPSAVASSDARLRITVALSDEAKQSASAKDTVFVFARAEQGPPMPLAVKRFKVAELPVSLELTEADAMMPELTLASVKQVWVQARISNSGNATEGEWESIGRIHELTDETPIDLLIDTAIKQQ